MARKGNASSADIVSATITTPTTNTWAMWYKGAVDPPTGIQQPIAIATSDTDADMGFSWGHSSAAFRQAAYQRDSVGYKAAKLTTSLSADIWYPIAGRYDGTNLECFLNGISEVSIAAGDPRGANPSCSVLAGIAGTGNWDDGTMANVGFWGVALTDEEILMMAYGVSPTRIRVESQIFCWLLLDTSSPEPDYSGNGRNGTVTGTTQADGPPVAPPFGYDLEWTGAFTEAPAAGWGAQLSDAKNRRIYAGR